MALKTHKGQLTRACRFHNNWASHCSISLVPYLAFYRFWEIYFLASCWSSTATASFARSLTTFIVDLVIHLCWCGHLSGKWECGAWLLTPPANTISNRVISGSLKPLRIYGRLGSSRWGFYGHLEPGLYGHSIYSPLGFKWCCNGLYAPVICIWSQRAICIQHTTMFPSEMKVCLEKKYIENQGFKKADPNHKEILVIWVHKTISGI